MYTDYLKEISELMMNCEIYRQQDKVSDWNQGFEEIVSRFLEAKRDKQQIFFLGNGGSSAIASHMTADFMKNGGMRTVSLYDNALITCMGNDYGYEYVFSKPLDFLINSNDLLVVISSSGNSANVVNAIRVAKGKSAKVITFTGFLRDNLCKQLGDYNLYVPDQRYGMVESLHNLFLQQIVDVIAAKDGVTL